MKNVYVIIIGSIIALLTTLFACRHEIVNGYDIGNINPPEPASTCSADTVYFVNEIQPIISSNCTMSGCHDAITHAEGVNLTTYNNIRRYTSPGNASVSKLYKVIVKTNGDRMPPAPMAPLSAAQIAKVQKWINQGALNNNCSGGCDTAVFTYSGAIQGLMNARCAGCHNPASLGGGIDVSTYATAKVVALNGKLYGSVAHLSGYAPMPKNSSRLTDCEIRQIQQWVNAGAPNN